MNPNNVSIQKEQANQIVQKHFLERGLAVHEVYEIDSHRFSYTARSKSFALDLTSPNSNGSSTYATHSCFLTIAIPEDATITSTKHYHTNPLPVIHQLINKIRTQTEIPILDSTLDTTQSVIPYDFLLSPPTSVPFSRMVPLSEVRGSGNLTEKDIVQVELLLGKLLGQLHSGVQNDWYGLPSTEEPKDPSYSWQETFTLILEELLEDSEKSGDFEFIPFPELRAHLSRAIGSFLFDDVEVPSLVWFTGSEDDIYLTLPSTTPSSTPDGSSTHPPMIAAILPNVAHALWGDPLLESIFLPPHPSDPLKDGYKFGGGSPLLLFERQKTKRIWYTIFLTLLVVRERRGMAVTVQSKKEWAIATLKQCVQDLKDAPTY
ncbi:hypothetical protein BDN72DRAFT_959114 [Pluteus cervinus]|uniref:Uncharacterized protein n=1 Tax=Pluteus cervinus TaxID=181527 RepID=A0ACD3AWA4_9AGAR|nr:hypothetical protein BDN72DRAFT_959114 [Pluteus cervinus]